jgi:hypothetical protein
MAPPGAAPDRRSQGGNCVTAPQLSNQRVEQTRRWRGILWQGAVLRLAAHAHHVDMRWPVNPLSLTVVLTLGFVQAGGHMGTALDHADIRGF